MKKIVVVTLTSLIPTVCALAQAPGVLWSKTFGDSERDVGKSVFQLDDGGYIVGASHKSPLDGWYDCYLVRTDENGDSLWSRTYGDAGWTEDLQCMALVHDGGYVFAGNRGTQFVKGDIYVARTDSAGTPDWVRYFGVDSLEEIATWIEQTSDSSFIVCGHYWTQSTGMDFYMMIVNPNGSMSWSENFRWSNADYAYCVSQTADGGYIIGGKSSSTEWADYDAIIVKTTATGITEWDIFYGELGDEACYHVIQTHDGGYVFTGNTTSYGANGVDAYVMKTDDLGILEWRIVLGGAYSDAFNHIIQLEDDGYAACGYRDNGAQAWVVRLNADGDTLWTGEYGGSGYDNAAWIERTSDGGYILAGSQTVPGGDPSQVWLAKLDVDSILTDVVSDGDSHLPYRFDLSQNYPNPFNPVTTIEYNLPQRSHVTIEVYNILGQKVYTLIDRWQLAGSYTITWDGVDTSSRPVGTGVYLYRFLAGDYVETKKMLLLK